jgi:hypothetical protein
MKAFFIVFAATSFLFLTQFVPSIKSQTGVKSFRLGFVKNSGEFGDQIWLANTKEKDQIAKKVIAILGNNFTGIININGRDIKLKCVKDYLPIKSYKVGRGGYQIWKGKNIKVQLNYVFTWLCPPKDEQCEVYYYKGVLDIHYKGKRRKVNITAFGG